MWTYREWILWLVVILALVVLAWLIAPGVSSSSNSSTSGAKDVALVQVPSSQYISS